MKRSLLFLPDPYAAGAGVGGGLGGSSSGGIDSGIGGGFGKCHLSLS